MANHTSLPARPSWPRRIAERYQTVAQLFGALYRSPFWWLTPFCIALVVFAGLLMMLQAIPAAAPFVYAVF